MISEEDEWLKTGQGNLPLLDWAFSTDDRLSDFRLARETGEIFAADVSGGFYLLASDGHIRLLNRLGTPARALAQSDAGASTVVLAGDRSVGLLTPKLTFAWTRELPDSVLSIAVNPFGSHLAIAMVNAVNAVYDSSNRNVAVFESTRPLRFMQFSATAPDLVGVAEYGYMARFNLKGTPEWTQSLWNTIGEMATSGDLKNVWLASFMHGLQLFNGVDGSPQGSFVLDGTVSRVASPFTGGRLFAATLERHLICLTTQGGVQWVLNAPDDIVRIVAGPMGDFVLVGLASGRILRLSCIA